MADETYSLELTGEQLTELQDLLAMLSNSPRRDLKERAEEMLALSMSNTKCSA